MARITSEALEQLRLKKEKLEAKYKQLKQQQQYQERKDETRRKIITGASVAAAVRDGVVSPKLLAYVLNKYVTKQNERQFMGLEVKGAAPNEALAESRGEGGKDDAEVSGYEEGREYFSDEELAEMGIVEPGSEGQRVE